MKKYTITAGVTILIIALIGLFIWNETRPYTPSMIRGKDWVPDKGNACGIPACSGIVDFEDPKCYLKNDGIIYEENKPVAKLIESYQPFISESAPRSGSYIKFQRLNTQSFCSFDSAL